MIEIDDIEKTIFDTVSQVASVKKIDVYDTEKLVSDVGDFLINQVVKNEHPWSVQRFAMQYALNSLMQKNTIDNYSSRFDLFDHFKKRYDKGLTMGGQWRQHLYQDLTNNASVSKTPNPLLTPSSLKR